MKFRHFTIITAVFSILLVFSFVALAQEPTGYYNAADGKRGATLKTSLCSIIRTHKQLEYYSSSGYFLSTDWHPDGYIWDMYSNYKRTSWTYDMNREHSMPKSWWSATPENTVAYSDLHNLYPSDVTANSAKLNYSLGEVTGTPIFSNGVVKTGINGFPGNTETIFGPADQYKGDFARDYMYVVTCYEEYSQNWRSSGMLTLGTYPVFKSWAVNLLLKWHRQDPVSTKEINRNNAVYGIQNNRNPYIDHPELAEFVWGKYTSEAWSVDGILPEAEVALEVYYNVSTSLLHVKINKPAETTYYILSLSGITLKKGKLSAQGTVSIGELSSGMYILVAYSGTIRKVGKFILQRP